MSCNTDNIAEIIQGADDTIISKIVDADNDPYDLTGFTEIKACFVKSDGSILTLTETGGDISCPNPASGMITIAVNDVNSALLKTVEKGNFEVLITGATGLITIVQFLKKLTVLARKCV
jgi:hypothetical protein